VRDTPSPDSTAAFDRKNCFLIIVEAGLCRDLGIDEKLAEKADKYPPFVTALKQHQDKVEPIAIPIGHADTTIHKSPRSIAVALSITRPTTDRARPRQDVANTASDSAARTHESTLFNSLAYVLAKLAHTRLITHRQRLEHSYTWSLSRTRAYSDAPPTQLHYTWLQGASSHTHTHTHTHRMRTSCIPESTVIT
jgi:hypothetical protein